MCIGNDRKNKMAIRPLIGWDFFDVSETAERSSTKLDRKQDLNVLYQVCVIGPIRKQDGHPDSDWLIRFRLLLWNRSTVKFHWIPFCGFEAVENVSANQRSGGHLVFPIGPKNTNFVEGVDILLPVKFRWIPGSKISTSSTKFVGQIGKTRWPPRSLICWDIFDFSKSAYWNSMKPGQ